DAGLPGEVRCESDILVDPEGPEEVVRGPEVPHERLTVALEARQRGEVKVGAAELVPRADSRECLPRRVELRLGLGIGAARLGDPAERLLSPAEARAEVRLTRDHQPLHGEVRGALELAVAPTRLGEDGREPSLEGAVAELRELLDGALEV